MADRQRNSRRQYMKREHAGRIGGPGIFATCVRGKEKQTVSELYDVFDNFSAELWPDEVTGTADDDVERAGDEADESLENEIQRELEALKRPRKQKRFSSINTETPCFVFISCRPPVEPVKLVYAYLEDVESKKRAQTRYVHRLIPASEVCTASLPEMLLLTGRLCAPVFEQTEHAYRYKIEINIINHSKLKKDDVIPSVAKCVPEGKGHTVDLKHPEVVILIQIFKTICAMSVVRDYERFRKFNVIQLAEDVKVQANQSGEADTMQDIG